MDNSPTPEKEKERNSFNENKNAFEHNFSNFIGRKKRKNNTHLHVGLERENKQYEMREGVGRERDLTRH
jgi:hypothetical protein